MVGLWVLVRLGEVLLRRAFEWRYPTPPEVAHPIAGERALVTDASSGWLGRFFAFTNRRYKAIFWVGAAMFFVSFALLLQGALGNVLIAALPLGLALVFGSITFIGYVPAPQGPVHWPRELRIARAFADGVLRGIIPGLWLVLALIIVGNAAFQAIIDLWTQ
jgi:hypothetical protein